MKTRIGGTIDFVSLDDLNARSHSQNLAEISVEEAVSWAAIGTRAHFPGAVFTVAPPAELEWPQRRALAAAVGENDPVAAGDLLHAAAKGFAETSARFQ